MIPSFTSFPSQPQQQDLQVPAPSSEHEPSKKDRKRNKERTRDGDEPEKRRRKHKHKDKDKRRDRDRDFKEDDRWEASPSSTTFFSDHRGNRAAAHGGGADPIRVPKYNLVARTSPQNLTKCN